MVVQGQLETVIRTATLVFPYQPYAIEMQMQIARADR